MHPSVNARAPRRAVEAWIVALAIVIVAVGSLFAQSRDLRRTFAAGDFGAFYCGATLVRERIDPYLAAPLEACERERTAAPRGTPLPDGIDPAPLPGYVFALVLPFSLLPFAVAAVLWSLILVGAVITSVEIVHRLTGMSRPPIAAALMGTAVVGSVTYGQLAPLATLGVVAAAYSLQRGKPRTAALAAALALLQPQLGAAVMLSLLVWVPRARTTVIAIAAALTAISLAAIGSAANVEFVRAVLPAQALAEAPFQIQLSLTWLLFFFGASEAAALRIASAEYIFLLVAGILIVRRLRERFGPEAIVLVPAAVALLGGTYLHIFQLTAVVPCALLLAMRRRPSGALGWIAVALLAVPWQATGSRAIVVFAAAAAAIIANAALASRPAAMRALAAAAAAAFCVLEPLAVQRIPATIVRPAANAAMFANSGVDLRLAPAQHGLVLRAQPERVQASWQTFWAKLPDWAALAFFIAALALANGDASRRSRVPAGPPA